MTFAQEALVLLMSLKRRRAREARSVMAMARLQLPAYSHHSVVFLVNTLHGTFLSLVIMATSSNFSHISKKKKPKKK